MNGEFTNNQTTTTIDAAYRSKRTKSNEQNSDPQIKVYLPFVERMREPEQLRTGLWTHLPDWFLVGELNLLRCELGALYNAVDVQHIDLVSCSRIHSNHVRGRQGLENALSGVIASFDQEREEREEEAVEKEH